MHKPKITFMVDDDEVFVYAMKKLVQLKELSESFVTFNRVQEAINYLTSQASQADALPDVILLDVNMPELDGWDFLNEYQKLRSNLSKTPKIYMLSSSVSPDDHQRAEKNPDIEAFLIKPISKENLEKIFHV